MAVNPQIAVLNSTMRAADDCVNLVRLLASHYEGLSSVEKDQFASALIMEVGAREAMKKVQS